MTKEWAIETTRKIFQDTTDDTISLRDIFIKFGRQEYDEEKNKAWFSNILSNVKRHNLLTPQYALKRGKRVLDKVKLTLEAKTILGWYSATGPSGPVSTHGPIVNSISVDSSSSPDETQETSDDLGLSIKKLIAEFNKKNPDVEGEFVVKLKVS